MIVNNYPLTVPDNVVKVFDGVVPFGSDYIYFCSECGDSPKYEAYYRTVGSDIINRVVCRTMGDGSFVFSTGVLDDEYDSLSGTHPEYCYSSVPLGGMYHDLGSGSQLSTVMLVVVCCLVILRTVFGGVRWVRSRRSYF